MKAEIYVLVRIAVAIDVLMHQKKHCLSVLILIGSQFITIVALFIGLPWLYLLLKCYFFSLKEQREKAILLILKDYQSH